MRGGRWNGRVAERGKATVGIVHEKHEKRPEPTHPLFVSFMYFVDHPNRPINPTAPPQNTIGSPSDMTVIRSSTPCARAQAISRSGGSCSGSYERRNVP